MIKGCMMWRWAFFTTCFSAAGGCGPIANIVLKRLACCIATHQRKSYSHTLCWLCCHIDFSLIRSAILCLGSCHSSSGHLPDPLIIELAVHEG